MPKEIIGALIGVVATATMSATNYVVTGRNAAEKALIRLDNIEGRVGAIDSKLDKLLERK